MDYSLSFPAFIGLCGVAAWFLIQRQVKKNDDEAVKAALIVDERLKDQGVRISQLNDRVQKAELELAVKVGREELDRIYEKIDAIKKEIKDDFKDFRADLLDAIKHGEK